MKKSKFTDRQIIAAIKRGAAGLSVPDVCRALGVSAATFYKWRSQRTSWIATMATGITTTPENFGTAWA